MNKLSILRFKDDGKETQGEFFITGDGQQTILKGYTLELPYKDNQHQVSCIPCGTFKYKKCLATNHIPYEHLALEVSGRDGVCVHAGNYYTNSLGCVLVGDDLIDINKDSEADTVNSRQTLKKILDLLLEEGMISISEK